MSSHDKEAVTLPRRNFLKLSTVLASGLAIGFHWPQLLGNATAAGSSAAAATQFEPNAWVRILADNSIKIVVHKHDSGTGTLTALAACVAEELDVDPMQIEVITPENPFFEVYIHPVWKVFSTGGSTSVSLEYDRLRQAGATARVLLIAAAAKQWAVSPASCSSQDGRIVHAASGRSASYGELAEAAAQLPVPEKVTLKDPAQFKYIGKLKHKRHAAEKVNGSFRYSIDVNLPGMWVAVIERAPVIGAKVLQVDASAALKVAGVHQVMQVPAHPGVLGGNFEGVAVLARDYWSAEQGRAVLKIRWSESRFAGFNSAALGSEQAKYLESANAALVPTIVSGNVEAHWPQAGTLLEANYLMPYKVQNPLEPVCITAWVKDGGISYWGGVQVPSSAREAAQVVCGIPMENVTINDMVSGGSFGARESKYWLFEVAYLANKTGKPVKLINSRKDEMRSLFGHPATFHMLKGSVDAQGKLSGLKLRAVSPASPEEWEPGYLERPDHMDYSTTEAISPWDFAYRAEHMDIGWVRHETGIPTGWYRSVSFIPNVFAVESFMDELANAAGRDPLEFRLAHMYERPRHVSVLRQAAERAGWGRPLPAGTSLGIATNEAYHSYVAVVAKLVQEQGRIRIDKLTCVVDCGLAVSPGGVEEQVYGGLMWGLGHALFDRMDIENGQVLQSNFHDYRVARMSDMPEVEIILLQEVRNKPGGVGELTSPPVAPAIANALFRLTGDRQRSTPLALVAPA